MQIVHKNRGKEDTYEVGVIFYESGNDFTAPKLVDFQAAEAVVSAVAGLKTDLARVAGDRQYFVNSLAEALHEISSLRRKDKDYDDWMNMTSPHGTKTIPATARQRGSETLITRRGSRKQRLR